MFASLGRFAARRRRLVVLVTLVLAAVGGVWGTGVFSNVLGGSGFESPSMEAVQVERLMDGPLGRYATDVVVMYESDTLTVDSPAFASAVRRAVGTVPPGAVTRLESYWTTHDPSFVAKDRKATYVVIQLPSSADSERVAQLRALEPGLRAAGLTTSLGGTTSMTMQVNRLAVSDLVRAEALSLPLVLVLLLFVFRGLIPGLVPLAIGLIVIPGALAVLRVVSSFVEMSTYAVNVVSILGLGLAIDYALLMVTRFREELATRPLEEAVWRTMASAGRTVAFSGLTVAASFACLLVFPSRFLVSMAWGGIATVAVAVVVSLTFLPALMRMLGARLVGRSRPAGRRWYGVARAVMRRPLLSTVVIVAALLALATPFLGVNWARPGDWVLPPGAEARHVTEQLAARFTGDPSRAVTGVISSGDVSAYLARFRAVEGVTSAEVTGSYRNLTRVEVRYSADPMSVAARHMIEGLRATGARFAGMAASRVDIVDMVLSRIPLMALALVAVSFVVLFLAFGSVVLPIKAVLLNLLSLTAAFGAIKLVFQDGWLSGLLGFVPVGAVDINFPVLVVGLALGLAMDYEVFLLARIREEYLRTGDARESVALGLQHTGRVITSAALLMAVVVAGFMTAQITLMLMIGVGLTIAVVVDATVIRALLLPSTMALLGRWAWWAPRPLSRIRTFHPGASR